MDKKTYLIFGALLVGVIGLLFYVRSVSEPRELVNQQWPGTEVTCLPFGHQNLVLHIHPQLAITVDGVPEEVPGNVGITEGCMAEVHTHEPNGQLHLESTVLGKTFTLLDYYAVLGEPIERPGYTYEVFANGQPIDPANHELSDGERVEVQYTSNGT